eukprot:1176323-Prorocentrum_minimum.AAC.4
MHRPGGTGAWTVNEAKLEAYGITKEEFEVLCRELPIRLPEPADTTTIPALTKTPSDVTSLTSGSQGGWTTHEAEAWSPNSDGVAHTKVHAGHSVTDLQCSGGGQDAQGEQECTGSREFGGGSVESGSSENGERECELPDDDCAQTDGSEKGAASQADSEQGAGTPEMSRSKMPRPSDIAHKQVCLSKMWQLAMEMNALYARAGRGELFCEAAPGEALEQALMKTLDVLNSELKGLSTPGQELDLYR